MSLLGDRQGLTGGLREKSVDPLAQLKATSGDLRGLLTPDFLEDMADAEAFWRLTNGFT